MVTNSYSLSTERSPKSSASLVVTISFRRSLGEYSIVPFSFFYFFSGQLFFLRRKIIISFFGGAMATFGHFLVELNCL